MYVIGVWVVSWVATAILMPKGMLRRSTRELGCRGVLFLGLLEQGTGGGEQAWELVVVAVGRLPCEARSRALGVTVACVTPTRDQLTSHPTIAQAPSVPRLVARALRLDSR